MACITMLAGQIVHLFVSAGEMPRHAEMTSSSPSGVLFAIDRRKDSTVRQCICLLIAEYETCGVFANRRDSGRILPADDSRIPTIRP
jgi:hypothetical protein